MHFDGISTGEPRHVLNFWHCPLSVQKLKRARPVRSDYYGELEHFFPDAFLTPPVTNTGVDMNQTWNAVVEFTVITTGLGHCCGCLLWPPCVADADIIFLPCGFFFFYSSPILSRRRLDVYRSCTHSVALVRIKDAGLKCAARGLMKIHDAKIRHLGTIAKLYQAVSSQQRHASTIGKNC